MRLNMKIILKIIKDKRGFLGISAEIGSALIGGISGAGSTAASIKAAKEAQEAQIKWERERAQNAHQWEVADLKAAGLNPILSAGGSGAQTGSISAPMPDTTGINSAGEAFSKAAQRAIERKRVAQEGKQIDANVKTAEETARKLEEERKQTELQNQILKTQLPAAQTQEKYAKSKVGQTLQMIGQGAKDIAPVAGVVIGGTASYMGAKAGAATSAWKKGQEIKEKTQTLKMSKEAVKHFNKATKDNWINYPAALRGQMRY